MESLDTRFPKRAILAAILLAAMSFVVAGCGASSAGTSSTTATPARASIPATDATAGSDAANGLKRTSTGGNVTVDISWEKELTTSSDQTLRFKTVLDTHSFDLDTVDLSKQAVLRNDSGQEVRPERWDAPKGGHHRSGTLVFPATVAGAPLIGPQTKYIEVVVRDVAGVKERSLKWETGS